jgi:hypothetical protein
LIGRRQNAADDVSGDGMKHAGHDALDQLTDMLLRLREVAVLKERSPGVFYRSGKAFLHFHEDPTGLYADLRRADTFERLAVNTASERKELVRVVRDVLENSIDR